MTTTIIAAVIVVIIALIVGVPNARRARGSIAARCCRCAS
jgi:hypothetical protein